MKIEWTSAMYHHLSLLVLLEVYSVTEWVEEEYQQVEKILKSGETKLTLLQLKTVINRARRLSNKYERTIQVMLNEKYGYDYDDIFEYQIDFDQAHYEFWKQAVKKQQTVKLVYDSTTSGVSERLVDPYRSKAPYGEGYCHTRKEIRKFRFDRVIDIKMTESRFAKQK